VLLIDVRAKEDYPPELMVEPSPARPVHLIITMIKWIRTSRLSIPMSVGILVLQELTVELSPYHHLYGDP